MTSFYRSQLMANQEIDKTFNTAMKNHCKDLSVTEVILNITGRFEVGDKVVLKRLNLLCKSNNLEIIKDVINFDEDN